MIRLSRITLAAAAILFAAACTDQPLAPVLAPPPDGAALGRIGCDVDVRAGTVACAALPASGAVSRVILGGQEVYVRLASTGSSYDGGAGQFTTTVTVQNLISQAIGTPDGSTVTGARVFLDQGPTVTGGSGNVAVSNPDGMDFFLSAAQPFFLYSQILDPYQVSQPKPWIFSLDATVTAFRFVVYVSAAVPDESGQLLDRVWDGSEGSAWAAGANWVGGAVPDSTSTVAIPAGSLFTGAMPVLSADATLTNLRVGFGSTLDLAGHTLEARGNVDAPGAVQNGTVRVSGTGAKVGGTLPSVRITGSAKLQSAVRTTGAVSISDGSLNVADRPLSIQVP